MIYKYRTGFSFAVKPNTAGKELERIRTKYGQLAPRFVVAEAEPEDAPLHRAFEWDDTKAANSFREAMARNLIRSVLIVREKNERQPMYVHVRHEKREDNSYEPLVSVIKDPDKLAAALEELHNTVAAAADSVITILHLTRKAADNQRAKRVVTAKEAIDGAREAVLAI